MKRTALVASLVFFSSVASAWEVTAKVIRIEATWVPDYVLFQLDSGMSNCNGYGWLQYTGSGAGQTDSKKNVQAAYAALLTALQTGKKVYVNVSNCAVINIQPTNQ